MLSTVPIRHLRQKQLVSSPAKLLSVQCCSHRTGLAADIPNPTFTFSFIFTTDFFFGQILLCWPKLAEPDKAYMRITFSPKHLRVYENHHCSTWKCEVNVHQKNISQISNLGPGWDTTSEVVFQPTILWSWCQTAVKTCLKEKGKCQNHPALTTTTTTKLSKSYSLSLESIQSNIPNVATC